MNEIKNPFMPNNKEELYGILYEFDTQVRSMSEILKVSFKQVDNIPIEELLILSNYQFLLGMLESKYDRLDRILSEKAQTEEA